AAMPQGADPAPAAPASAPVPSSPSVALRPSSSSAAMPRRAVPAVPADASAPAQYADEPAAEVDLSPTAIRAWAREQGIPVGDRGRLKAELVARYREAM